MRTYPKWVRKIKLVALYGVGGCFGLFVILFIVALVMSDNDKAGSGSESPAASASESEHADATDDLFEAAPQGTVSEVKAALAAGADPGARAAGGNTPLHVAATFNANPSVIVALIEGGADPGARNEDGKTPFDYAKNNEALKGTDAYWLLNESPAASAPESPRAVGTPWRAASALESPADALFEAAGSGTASEVKAALAAGADIGARNENLGNMPLHVAATFNANPSVIVALIEGGADPGARNEDGKTPFDYAKNNEALKGTDAYWLLNDGRFE